MTKTLQFNNIIKINIFMIVLLDKLLKPALNNP